MKRLFVAGVLVFCLLALLLRDYSIAWDDGVTHKDLSELAAEQSVLGSTMGNYLRTLGFQNGLEEWLQLQPKIRVMDCLRNGAALEDAGNVWQLIVERRARHLNHFHNPLKPWDQAGLDDYVILEFTGQSSVLWAQDGINQLRFPKGDWSWGTIRQLYYSALTATTEADRNAYFADTFQGLGHQMHLVQDLAVPEHVRNDAHPFAFETKGNLFIDTLESWAKDQKDFVQSLANSPLYPEVNLNISRSWGGVTLVPITQFSDTDRYLAENPAAFFAEGLATSPQVGLAEYVTANYFSMHTIFAADDPEVPERHRVPYPKKTSTSLEEYLRGASRPDFFVARDGVRDDLLHIRKIADGQEVTRFLKPTYFTYDTRECLEFSCEKVFLRTFYHDAACHEDYVTHLIPRAVGYSTALLDYFFRGRMDAVNVEETRAVGSNRLEDLKLSVKNKTPNEGMGPSQAQPDASRFVVSYRYKASPGQSYIYGVSNNVVTLGDVIPPDGVSTTSFSFTFPDGGIPPDASSLEMWLVYRGRLGEEDDAVAVQNLVEGLPVIFPNRYNYIDTPGGTSGKPQYETSGLVRQLGQTGLRLQNEAEAGITEIELSVPGIEGLEVHFFINSIEITDRVWTYGNSFASTGIPDTWKMTVVGNTDAYNYNDRIRMRVRYNHIDGQKHYEYAPLQLVGDWVGGSSYHYEEPYGLRAAGAPLSIECQDQYQSREYFSHSTTNLYGSNYSLNQRWGYDARHFLNNRVKRTELGTFLVDYVRLSGDRRGWTAPNPPCSHSYYAGCNYYGNVWPETGSARDNNLEEAYAHFEYYCRNEAFDICDDLKSTTLNLVTGRYRDHQVITSSWTGDFAPTGECSYPYAPHIQDVPWPNTLVLSFDAPAGTELGNVIDEFGLRVVWGTLAPMGLELNFNNNAPEWSIRPY